MRLNWLRAVFVLALLLLIAPVFAQDEIVLEPFTDENFAIQGVAPQGWQVAAPGVRLRGASAVDPTSLILQAAPGLSAEQLGGALLPNLSLTELPEPVERIETDALAWDIYRIEVSALGQTIVVDLALAESDNTAYLVVLQAPGSDYETLHEQVFLPVVEAYAPLGAEDGGPEVYESPDGLWSVPVPTNWTLTEGEGYALLSAPEDSIRWWILAVPDDDTTAALEAAWPIVDPEFDLEVNEDSRQIIENDPVLGPDIDRVESVFYDTGEDSEHIVQAVAQLVDGISYVFLVDGDLTAIQQRAAQVNIINTGFKVTSVEEADLSDAEPRAIDEALTGELAAYIEGLMEDAEVIGASVAIVADGEVVYSEGFGERSIGGEPVQPDTQMLIASVTKPITTTLMAMLVDDGVLDWDTPAVEYMPEFAVASDELTQEITVANLVCACTGVPRRDLELIFNGEDLTAEGIIESLRTFEFFTDFGEAFQYSNQLVAAGGYVATEATGAEYGSLYPAYINLMRERVFEPLGMVNTTFETGRVVDDNNYALPYIFTLREEQESLPLELETAFLEPIAPAGAAWSTAEDMAQFAILQLQNGVAPDGTRLVSEENLLRTRVPQVPITADASYGLGWILETWKEVPIVSHGGNSFGFSSELAFLPDHNIAIVVLVNQRASVMPSAVRYRLMELLFEQEAEYDAQIQFLLNRADEDDETMERLSEQVDAEMVAPYLGIYPSDELGPITISLDEESGSLVFDAGAFVVPLWAYTDPDDGEVSYVPYYTSLLGIAIEFEEAEDGSVTMSFGSGAVAYELTKAE